MSRIGKKTIEVPKGVKVSINGRTVSIEGPKGTLSFEHRPEVKVGWTEDEKGLVVDAASEKKADDRLTKAYWGTTRALLANMIKGVTDGYEKKLEVVGVGWTANVSGQNLALKVGFANVVEVPIPTGLNVSVEKQLVTVTGTDKQAVGQFAAKVRSKRKPEPYNGKGIKYFDEVIKKKQGKAFGN
ncbi:MAG: 50S ribosomal protein L6 [Phycisphaeraceae bacterium]|nr:MAG: 50S ribosomal protein L6 [Phycisphaeraceae bacterium]